LIDLCKEKESERIERLTNEDFNINVDKVIAALDAATNVDVPENQKNGPSWFKMISSAWFGSGGAHEALDAFQRWSAKNKIKHNTDRNKDRWKAFFKKPPTGISVGSLYQHADKTAPGWREAYEQASLDAIDAAFAKSKTEAGR
jgi:hypothetical protein